MKNVPLPCPFANCRPVIPDFGRPTGHNTFLRERDLIAHLEGQHSDLVGSKLDPRSELLLPSWEPRPPILPLAMPPDLPMGKIPRASFRLEEPRKMESGWFSRVTADRASTSTNRLAPPLTRVPTPSLTLIPLTPKTPAGRRPLLPNPSITSVLSEHDSEPQYDLADLPDVVYDADTGGMARLETTARGFGRFHPYQSAKVPIDIAPPRFAVRRVSDRAELVRPLRMPQAPMPEAPPPPTSIFYEELRQQVYTQYALGEDAASDSPSAAPPPD